MAYPSFIDYLYGMILHSEAFLILRKLTMRRIWNAGLVFISYHLSRFLKKPIHLGNPISISVEPTTACNLRCPECPSGLRSFTRPTGNLQFEFYKKTIDQIYKDTSSVILYFQGEPFIHPKFTELCAYAHQKKLYTITSTNGHFLDEKNCHAILQSGLDRLIISIDGTTQEVYESYRKEGNLQTVLEGAKRLIHLKHQLKSATPWVVFQFLVVKPNEHQIPEIKNLAQEIGVDQLVFKTAQVYDFKNGNPLIPENALYSRYKAQADGSFQIKNKLLNQCWKLWHSCVITWDGKIVPCCFDKDAQHEMGHLAKSDFASIWKGEIYYGFRNQILFGRSNIEICRNCTEGTKVWA